MPSFRHSISALRALSALFLYRVLQPVLVMTVIILVAAYVMMILLSISFSAWWWLLLILLIPLTLIFVFLCFVMWFVLRKLQPRKLTRDEQTKIQDFIEKLFSIAERGKLPYPVLVVLVAKDVIRGKESRFLRNLIGNSKSLTHEFAEIRGFFKE